MHSNAFLTIKELSLGCYYKTKGIYQISYISEISPVPIPPENDELSCVSKFI